MSFLKTIIVVAILALSGLNSGASFGETVSLSRADIRMVALSLDYLLNNDPLEFGSVEWDSRFQFARAYPDQSVVVLLFSVVSKNDAELDAQSHREASESIAGNLGVRDSDELRIGKISSVVRFFEGEKEKAKKLSEAIKNNVMVVVESRVGDEGFRYQVVWSDCVGDIANVSDLKFIDYRSSGILTAVNDRICISRDFVETDQ